MSTVKLQLQKLGFETALNYLYANPEKNMLTLLDWADKFAGDMYEPQRRLIREAVENPDHPYYGFVRRVLNDLDEDQVKKLLRNFFIYSNLYGWKIGDQYREKYNCNIPWAILLDPTSACNLKCVGCWAAEYGHKLNLSKDEINDIIRQGKELGVYMYIYTGGEPTVRKKDLVEIAEENPDCVFLFFTNGTLIDEAFAAEMKRVGNMVPAISLEGNREVTDSRRGEGVYDSVRKAMKIMHDNKLIYGISACYTSANYDSISSDEFLQEIIDEGAYFIWYFHYMPVGNDAVKELLPTPEQRTEVYHRIRDYRANKGNIFIMDFQNDAEYTHGCIAGGRRYLHINSNGDVDPCVFIHYSDSNIREKSLLDSLRSPMFMQYHDNIPFNDNMLKPCPMLENSGKLVEMVKAAKAHSTDLESPESAEHLCEKTKEYAESWAPTADELWASSPNGQKALAKKALKAASASTGQKTTANEVRPK